ncbi:hypothetical protein CKAN_00005700 [Cinnamomum micranthum f. kanehirae]|uniref:SnoaL-like domain-containing protein n=1 Tax=Cinnamomum micranthum f. kanehirae TaxID=337451 RepID=A0A443N017_9MAGN|nr:hypothetical protein CKAN_00005700 [Cinnamomum micranthum f. kanehirae]
MSRALSSIQCHPRLAPRLADFRRISNVKHTSMNLNPSHSPKPNVSMAPSSYPHSFSFTRLRPTFPVPRANVSSDHLKITDGDDPEAIHTIVELYSAMHNRNLQALSDLIADDCNCTCYFTPLCNVHKGKENVVGFLTALLGSMGEHMMFEIETSCYGEGDNVGILWQLEWKGNRVPFGKGCTIYSCEEKEGKLLIRDMEMFMESYVKLGFLQLRLTGMLMLIFSKCMNLALKWIGMETSI